MYFTHNINNNLTFIISTHKLLLINSFTTNTIYNLNLISISLYINEFTLINIMLLCFNQQSYYISHLPS